MLNLTAEEKDQLQTLAFCMYVMGKENCDKQAALKIMAAACTTAQVITGIGIQDKSGNGDGEVTGIRR